MLPERSINLPLDEIARDTAFVKRMTPHVSRA
jgi:hypothetical protein